jgi:hypothetical protein
LIYEYRLYEAIPGRLPDLNKRFQDHSLRILKKYEIEQVGFWEAVVGTTNELHYILRFKDMAEREAKFAAIQVDPEWSEVKASTEAAGPIVARAHYQLWRPTPYSSAR